MADETRSEYKLVTEKKKEMKPVFDRMDVDEKLYHLNPYEMYQLYPNQTKKMEDVANITLPDPLLFITKAIAIIGGATRQAMIKGREMNDKQTTIKEKFLEDIYYMVDERLPKRQYPNMDAFINEQICIRGRIVGRSCITIDQEKGFIPDILPLDALHYVDETDGNDMVWAAPTFRRSKAQVERQYNKPTDRKVNLSKYPEIIPFWDGEKNVVFADKQILREQENPYGYPPFVSIICPIGSFLNTEGAEAHEGESILWANRNLWPEMNRCATILQTLNVNSLFAAIQYASKKGEGAGKPAKPPYRPRTVHNVEVGGGYQPMPMSDIKRATNLLYALLEGRLQRGSLSAIDYGTLTFPLSAIAITRLTSSRDDIFMPRIQAIALFYQALSRMIIKQCINLGEKLELGEEGNRNEYTKADLEGNYTIKYRFYTDTKEQQIANFSIAAAAKDILPFDTILRDILKVQDPDGTKIKWEAEQAERVDEVLFLYRRARSLLEEKDGKKPSPQAQIEARILKQRIVTILKHRQTMGQLSPVEKQKGDEPQPGKGVIPLLGEGRGGGGQGRTLEPEEPEEAKEVANA